jgi:hypothetical protein
MGKKKKKTWTILLGSNCEKASKVSDLISLLQNVSVWSNVSEKLYLGLVPLQG